MTELAWWSVMAAGVGTFLMRVLPLYWRVPASSSRAGQMLRNGLRALAPSAVISLLLASLWPYLAHGHALLTLFPVMAGLLGVALARWWRRGLALPMLFGLACYGLTLYLGVNL